MKEKQNIDQLFKERFQDMKATPPPAVWNHIEKQLDANKKDRKIIPLWWQLGSVAALLILALLVGGRLFFSPASVEINPPVVEQHPMEHKLETQKIPTTDSQEEVIKQNQIATDNTTPAIDADKSKEESLSTSSQTIVAVQNTTSNKKGAHKSTIDTPLSSSPTNTNKTPSKTAVASRIEKEDSYKNTKALEEKSTNATSSIAVVKNQMEEKPQQLPTPSNQTQVPNKKQTIAVEQTEQDPTNTVKEENKKSILDAIKEQQDAVVEGTPSQKRWEVMPTLAPVYYSSLTEGSSIDPTFADNSQSGDVNLSYGVQVSYAINKRLKVRTGISNVNLSYGTGDLELATGDVSAALQTINYNQSGIVTTAVDRGAIAQAAPGSPFANLTRKATNGDVLLTQNINYLEIPTELTYTVLDKKISLNVIGGFSTLFLGNNDISVSAGDFQSQLGEANNLTDVSFSTNVGLGMRYNFNQRFSFNVEPIFKYQLNPYTNSAVSFQPYYLGVYSGLSFRF